MCMEAFFRRAVKMTKKPIMSTDNNSVNEEDVKNHPKRIPHEIEISHTNRQAPMVHKNFVEHEKTTKDGERDVYDDQDIDVDMQASRFIKNERKKIGMATKDVKRDFSDDQDLNVDMEGDRFIKQKPMNIEQTKKDGKQDACDDQDMNVDIEADRFIEHNRIIYQLG
ncbi:hypothetical protein OROMI_007829 [Orobanche minor]